MNISISKASSEHTKEISRICSVGWRQTVQSFYSEKYQIKIVEYWYNHNRVHEDITKGIYTHVAKVDERVVGTIGGIMTELTVSEIYVFYVDEAYRYKGIGIDAFTKEHIKKGAIEQYVSVQEGNRLGIPFYESCGFQQNHQTKRHWRTIAK
ncbi:GNAT family N-acetyltransferase [Evansella halocellulosilytica]|uniref:GNAT family N-acetyltransferase n=1 Tax=Evansella halocellulosilytica TaxID=2011013 RepID=UPI000BB9B88F|nr:GNAT family N-acetyltransferase [Evansella halocellulosilytica]